MQTTEWQIVNADELNNNEITDHAATRSRLLETWLAPAIG